MRQATSTGVGAGRLACVYRKSPGKPSIVPTGGHIVKTKENKPIEPENRENCCLLRLANCRSVNFLL